MTMTTTRKFDTARIVAQAAHFAETKDRVVRRRRKGMSNVTENLNSDGKPFAVRMNGNMLIQIDSAYMQSRRRDLATRPDFNIETLLNNAQIILNNLDHMGHQQLQIHVAQVSYAFLHSGRDAVTFLTHYFSEIPHPQEINRRFFAARWTEQFEAADLHSALLNAYCVHESLAYWNGVDTPIHH